MSKEHIWPRWAAHLVPGGAEYGIIAGSADKKDRISSVREDLKRQGSITTFKVRNVCIECNSGWMSQYESNLKSVLEMLALGRTANVSAEQQKLLIDYLFYKALILDAAFENFLDVGVANAFFDVRTIPADVSIFILNCVAGRWRSGVRIMGGHFAEEITDPKAPPNVRTIALGFGNLFAYIVFRRGGVFEPQFAPGIALRLHPQFHPTFRWPPLFPIDSESAETIAMAMWHGGKPTVGDDFSGFPIFGSMNEP